MDSRSLRRRRRDPRATARRSSTPIHETVGHLGIFVSGGVARKEHGEFSSNIDLIDVLPPGLYEAMFEAKTGGYRQSRSRRPASGSCAARRGRSTISARWAAMTRPTSAASRPPTACRRSISRSTAPSCSHWCGRLSIRLWRMDAEAASAAAAIRAVFGANPLMAPVAGLAEAVRNKPQDRPPATIRSSQCRRRVSDQIVAALDAWREFNETCRRAARS